MLKTNIAVGLASASIGCSGVRAYVAGEPLTETAKQHEEFRLRREAITGIVPIFDVGPGYFKVQSRDSGYTLVNDKSKDKLYRPDTKPTGFFLFEKEF